jgi:hypothetical protein
MWVRFGAYVYLRALRVGTRNVLLYRDSAGRGAGGFAKFWLPPADTYCLQIGRKPVNRQFCQGSDARTRALAAPQIPKPKSGFFGSFLAKTRKEPPAAQALSSAKLPSFAPITNTATTAHS